MTGTKLRTRLQRGAHQVTAPIEGAIERKMETPLPVESAGSTRMPVAGALGFTLLGWALLRRRRRR